MTTVAIVEDNKTTREGLETIVNLSPDFHCVATCATRVRSCSISRRRSASCRS